MFARNAVPVLSVYEVAAHVVDAVFVRPNALRPPFVAVSIAPSLAKTPRTVKNDKVGTATAAV